jgi:hypothetical protein
LPKIEPLHSILSLKQQAQRIEKMLKAVSKKKEIMYKGKPTKITAYFSMGTLKARRAWYFGHRMKIISALGYSSQDNYHSKKIFYNKQKLKQYITTKPPLQKILQGIFL